MTKHYVTLEVEVIVNTTEEGEAGIDRYVDLPEGNEWQVTPGMTKDDVLEWIAVSTIYGRTNANQDGFADLNYDAFVCYIDSARLL